MENERERNLIVPRYAISTLDFCLASWVPLPLQRKEEQYPKEAVRENFVAVGAAVGRINEARRSQSREPRLRWHVHGH